MNRVEYRAELEKHGMSRELADLIAHSNETVDGGHVTNGVFTAEMRVIDGRFDQMQARIDQVEDRLLFRLGTIMVATGAGYTAILFFLLTHYRP